MNTESIHYTGTPALLMPMVQDLRDLSGRNQTITLTGGSAGDLIGRSSLGPCYTGDGSSTHIQITNSSSCALWPQFLDGSDPRRVVISCWFRYLDTGTTQEPFLSLGNTATAGSAGMILSRRGASGNLNVYFGTYIDTGVKVNDLNWHFVSIDRARDDLSFSLSATWVYVDGILRSTIGGHSNLEDNFLFVGAGFPDSFSAVQVKDLRVWKNPFGIAIGSNENSKVPHHAWHQSLWSPETRWDLYRQRRLINLVSPANTSTFNPALARNANTLLQPELS